MRCFLLAALVFVSIIILAVAGCAQSHAPESSTTTIAALSAQAQANGNTAATSVVTTTTNIAITTTTAAPLTTTTTGQKLVKVPSYTAFNYSYNGDDIGEANAAWQAAVEAGFRKAGLKADVEWVILGQHAQYQTPKAGKMVPKGTVVHIYVIIAD